MTLKRLVLTSFITVQEQGLKLNSDIAIIATVGEAGKKKQIVRQTARRPDDRIFSNVWVYLSHVSAYSLSEGKGKMNQL